MIRRFTQGSVLTDAFGRTLYFPELCALYIRPSHSPLSFEGQEVEFRFKGSENDLLHEDLTVYENLDFAARLCLAHLTPDQRKERVLSTLSQLNQLDIAHLKVGSPTEKTISGGQHRYFRDSPALLRPVPDV